MADTGDIGSTPPEVPAPPGRGFWHWPPGEDGQWVALHHPDGAEPDTPGSVVISYQHLPTALDGRPLSAYRLREQFAYYDDVCDLVLVAPHDVVVFRSDLASVPQLVSWFVPPIGKHLRPALIHDALVIESPRTRPPSKVVERLLAVGSLLFGALGFWALLGLDSWPLALLFGAGFVATAAVTPPDDPLTDGLTHIGAPVGRVTADRIFRDAMELDGTKLLRRWLMWSAVTTATLWDSPLRSRVGRWRGRILVLGTFGGIAALGVLATADLFDIWAPVNLPWMGDAPWWRELLLGALMAVVIPAGLSLAWLDQHRAALLGGIAVAWLFHVSVAVLFVYCVYLAIEHSTDWVWRRIKQAPPPA